MCDESISCAPRGGLGGPQLRAEVVTSEEPVEPCCSTAKRDRERLHGDAVVDNGTACFGQYSPLGSTDRSRAFTGSWRLRAHLVQSAQFSDLVRGGCATLRKPRIAGWRCAPGSFEGGADRLSGAAEFFGDLIEGLPVITAADDLVAVGDGLLTPPAEGDVVAGSREAIDVMGREVIAGPDFGPRFAGPVARGGVRIDLFSLDGGELHGVGFLVRMWAVRRAGCEAGVDSQSVPPPTTL